MRLRRLAGNALLVLASLAFGLLVLELGLRIVLTGRGGDEDGAAQQYLEFDERLGWRKRPGAQALFRRKEYVQSIQINSLGQRDRERVYDKALGTFRILALGDSYLEGYTVPLESTTTQLLERRLSRPGCAVQVLNAGTAGYSTDQEYLFFKNEGWRYEPNVVALFFYYNDIQPTLHDDLLRPGKAAVRGGGRPAATEARAVAKPGSAQATTSRSGQGALAFGSP